MSPRRRTVLTVVILLLIVAVAAVIGVWRVLGGAPEEVSLEEAVADAVQALEEEVPAAAPTTSAASVDAAADEAPSSGTDAGDGGTSIDSNDQGDGGGDASDAAEVDAATEATADLDGTWEVDAETGDFTLDDATGSFAGFRVDEELARIGDFTAVGRTGDVSGTLVIANQQVSAADIAVDLRTLQTDDSRRDGAVQRALRTTQHPTATFSLVGPLDISGAVERGEAVKLAARGDLTVNGITQPVVVDIEAQLVGSLIVVVGSVEVTFADFDVTVPQVPIVLSADDHGIMEFQLLFRRS